MLLLAHSRAAALSVVALVFAALHVAEAAGGLQPLARQDSPSRGHLTTDGYDKEAQADSTTRQSLRANADKKPQRSTIRLPKNWRKHIWHEIASGFVFFTCLLLCCIVVPITIYHRRRWGAFADDGDSFVEYGQYRFFNWFTRVKWAPATVLVSVTLFAVVLGAILYSVIVGGYPSSAMFKIFVWASASSADTESTVGGRFLGVLITVFGLIILALLLSMVTEAFHRQMEKVKMGLGNVCEGGHVVLLGSSSSTYTLLKEMAVAWESDGGTIFVILATGAKMDVEAQLQQMGIGSHIRNSKVIVRSGNPSSFHSLKQVAADKASKVLSLMDDTVSPDEALAKQIRVILALKSQAWPLRGTIVVQVASDADQELIRSMYPETETTKVEVVVMGDIIAKLMVQSAWEHGLATVFGSMLGFEGDEFYIKEFPELTGCTFRDAYFRVSGAVVLGVYCEDGALLSPGWDYTIKKGDELMVLAEDDDTYAVSNTPFFDYELSTATPRREVSNRTSHIVVPVTEAFPTIIIGWNHNVGKLLGTIAATFPKGCEVTVFSHVPQEERDKLFVRLSEAGKTDLSSIVIKHIVVYREDMTSRAKLKQLEHWNAGAIFVLADEEHGGNDDTSIAVLAQLQFIGKGKEGRYVFDPVVEMCEHSTKDHLRVADLDNLIHSNSLISQALSAVTYDPKVNEIYTEFFAKSAVGFCITSLEECMPRQQVPKEINFGRAAMVVSETLKAVLVGWTRSSPDSNLVEWELNPKDKLQQRAWRQTDRICIIHRCDPSAQLLPTASEPLRG